MPTGVIVAGGFSTRFEGGDKALADFAGKPMVRRVADRLAPAVTTLVVNCRAEQREGIEQAVDGYPHEVRFAVDPEPDAGPMAGIRTGLREAPDEYAIVVACDMPFVARGFVEYLFDRVVGHDAIVPELDGWYQTTQAVYRAEAMANACDRALERGDSKILAPLEELDWVVVNHETLAERGWLETFENVNTRAELREAEQRGTAGPSGERHDAP
jgi:molybdopterin-guanine dinucleotide biosynthesis protein A